MEIFLLLLDELDDAAAILRARLPSLIGLLMASGLFVLTVLGVMLWPLTAVLIMLAGSGIAWYILPGFRLQLRFKTDS